MSGSCLLSVRPHFLSDRLGLQIGNHIAHDDHADLAEILDGGLGTEVLGKLVERDFGHLGLERGESALALDHHPFASPGP